MALEESATTYISVLWLVRTSKAASIGALVVQSLELFNHIPEEIDYLWRTPFRLMTCLYALSRYLPLCVQIVNLSLSELIYANPRPKLCFVTIAARMINAQLLATCVEAILMIRVHALYNCSRRTGLFLLAIMIIGTILEFTGTALLVAGLEPGPKATICCPAKPPIEAVATFATGVGFIQATLLGMTVSRVIRYRKTGWMRTPLVSLVLRDGVFVFVILIIVLALFATLAVLIAVDLIRSENAPLLWNIQFSWYVTLVSIVGCRVVLNMRKLVAHHPRNQSEHRTFDSIQFSSLFEDQSSSACGDILELE